MFSTLGKHACDFSKTPFSDLTHTHTHTHTQFFSSTPHSDVNSPKAVIQQGVCAKRCSWRPACYCAGREAEPRYRAAGRIAAPDSSFSLGFKNHWCPLVSSGCMYLESSHWCLLLQAGLWQTAPRNMSHAGSDNTHTHTHARTHRANRLSWALAGWGWRVERGCSHVAYLCVMFCRILSPCLWQKLASKKLQLKSSLI